MAILQQDEDRLLSCINAAEESEGLLSQWRPVSLWMRHWSCGAVKENYSAAAHIFFFKGLGCNKQSHTKQVLFLLFLKEILVHFCLHVFPLRGMPNTSWDRSYAITKKKSVFWDRVLSKWGGGSQSVQLFGDSWHGDWKTSARFHWQHLHCSEGQTGSGTLSGSWSDVYRLPKWGVSSQTKQDTGFVCLVQHTDLFRHGIYLLSDQWNNKMFGQMCLI